MLIFFFRIINHEKQKQNRKRLVKLFEKSGVDHHLRFSSQEILNNSIIGFDGRARKFLYIDDKEKETIIALDDVKNVVVQKRMQPYINIGSKNRRSEQMVTSIDLSFHFKNKRDPFVITFFSRLHHPPALEKKMYNRAQDWEIILMKMLDSPAS